MGNGEWGMGSGEWGNGGMGEWGNGGMGEWGMGEMRNNNYFCFTFSSLSYSRTPTPPTLTPLQR
ncbi:MAG: hypothetical protein DSM106950_43215 [Stigonema ocellatum SAG 48.90 = DSM 106950]|nr:hypothetical protein [Stigonema ocellatum SAG 48.90 = DSM 106950]